MNPLTTGASSSKLKALAEALNQDLENVELRSAVAADDPFLLKLYTLGRLTELRTVGWGEDQIQSFCQMQYSAQTWHYSLRFPKAQDCIVLSGGKPIGRLKVYEDEEELMLVDIALVPEVQGQGIGTWLLEGLKNRAREAKKPLRLHVLVTSRGFRLYERLGFRRVADDGSYIEMEFRP